MEGSSPAVPEHPAAAIELGPLGVQPPGEPAIVLELEDLKLADFDLALTGFDEEEISRLLADDEASSDGDQEPTSG